MLFKKDNELFEKENNVPPGFWKHIEKKQWSKNDNLELRGI